MKAGREHRVRSPRSDGRSRADEEIHESEFVFAGGKRGKPLSNMAMLAVLKRMGRGDLTTMGSVDVSGLGGRVHELPEGGGRDGIGAYDREQGRGCLPPRGLVSEASAADGGLGAVLYAQQVSGRCPPDERELFSISPAGVTGEK